MVMHHIKNLIVTADINIMKAVSRRVHTLVHIGLITEKVHLFIVIKTYILFPLNECYTGDIIAPVTWLSSSDKK